VPAVPAPPYALPIADPAPAPTPAPGATPVPTESGTLRLTDLLREEPASTAACWQRQDGSFCRRVYEWTGSQGLADFVGSGWLFRPAAILLILVIAVVARRLLHRLIGRLAQRAAEGTVPGVLQRGKAGTFLEPSPLLSERRKQRADTMASVLKSVTTGVVFTMAGLMILAELGLDIAPLLASAGILGVALGFGAQTLVKDFLSGIFMILEDQYGVGDVVDLGEASGSVEAVGLRVTRVRSVEGTVWYVRNGEVLRVGNMSQGWARAVLDIQVAYDADVAQVRAVLERTAHALFEDEEWRELVIEEPEVWGVEALSADAIVVRLVLKTLPLKQWDVAREMRQRVKAALDAEGIETPFPQRTMWLRTEGPGRDAGAAAADSGGPTSPASAASTPPAPPRS
jgi:moderate conductance mechanosensitive channel